MQNYFLKIKPLFPIITLTENKLDNLLKKDLPLVYIFNRNG